ncbi:uncharacterized protein LOC144101709 [Amblyomma americanum]
MARSEQKIHITAVNTTVIEKTIEVFTYIAQHQTHINPNIAFILRGNEDISDSDWDESSDGGGEDIGINAMADDFATLVLDVFSQASPFIRAVNEKWNWAYRKDLQKPRCTSPKVTFSLQEPQVYIADDIDRKGPWEQFARDRQRFQSRIIAINTMLMPLFCNEHRQNMFKRFVDFY